jgi:hypothetical protein
MANPKQVWNEAEIHRGTGFCGRGGKFPSTFEIYLVLNSREIKPTLQMAPCLPRTIRRGIHANSQTTGQTWNALGRVSHTTPPLGVQDEK